MSQAVHVMKAMQGIGLSANNGAGTGIRIEFAKTRMGDNLQQKQEYRDGIGGRA